MLQIEKKDTRCVHARDFPLPPSKNTLRRVASPPSSTWAHEKRGKNRLPTALHSRRPMWVFTINEIQATESENFTSRFFIGLLAIMVGVELRLPYLQLGRAVSGVELCSRAMSARCRAMWSAQRHWCAGRGQRQRLGSLTHDG